MKKSFFLLISASILFGFTAKAQSNAAPAVGGGGGVISPAAGTEWGVSIVVTDSKGKPVSGAKVTLPCSGEPSEMTDATGNVDFIGAGICPCTNAPATVSTSKSNATRAVSCGTNYITLPQ